MHSASTLHNVYISRVRYTVSLSCSLSLMAREMNRRVTLFFLSAIFLQAFRVADGQSFIGVNYGQIADNLPAPAAAVRLLQSTSIGKVRLYGADPAVIRALAGTGIDIFIGASNGEMASLSSDPAAAKQWVAANILPYYPASNIILVSVGNEVLSSNDGGLVSQIVPAMQNLHTALLDAGLADKIKVTTVHSMAVLQQSAPPSAGLFKPAYEGNDVMKPLLAFLQQTDSPLAINPYPYFAYSDDPRPETLTFCLFQQNQGRFDPGTQITYYNMFDAQLDAVHSALGAVGFGGVRIVVAETGWPYKGGSTEVGPGLDNAKGYNGGLVAHLKSMAGTPLMPGKAVETYLFALFDEDLKGGAPSERYFGLYRPVDLAVNYDVGLTKSTQLVSPVPSPYTPFAAPPLPSPYYPPAAPSLASVYRPFSATAASLPKRAARSFLLALLVSNLIFS